MPTLVKSYGEFAGDIRLVQKFRLYHLDRPAVKAWRATRHSNTYALDHVDQWIIKNYNKINAIDFGGWYLKDFGIDVCCVESSELSKLYYPNCHVEFDLLDHKPTYLSADTIIVFKHPWFFRYLELDRFNKFLNVWKDSQLVLNFNPLYIQHNHLKFKLQDLITASVDIKVINNTLWTVNI